MARKKANAATIARLKALRRKHGLGEFKRSSRRASTKTRSHYMARRRSSRVRRYAKAGMKSEVLGAVLYGAVGENLLNSLTSKFNFGLGDDFVKGIAGYLIAKRTSGIVKGMATAAVSIAAYNVGKSGLSSLGGLFGSAMTTATQSNGATFA